MKPKSKQTSCPDVTSNQCVVWEGGEVKCLGICNGDQLSSAEKAIADKVCELADDLDLSDIDLGCLISTKKPKDQNLKNVLEVLLDNQCDLKDLMDNFTGTPPEIKLNLNLKCLKRFDEFNNEIVQDLNQVLQSSVNMLCVHDTDIGSLKTRMTDLEDDVATIPRIPPKVEEPNITTCLSPGLRPVSQTVPLVAQEVCNIQGLLGTVEQISAGLAQQCSNLNADYQIQTGWQLSASTIAQTLGNLWIVVCDLRDRIDLIEKNCCAVTCDDIKLGFEVVPNDDTTGIFLKFTSKSGTKIPIGFTDCGSKVIITDKLGNTVEYPLVIAPNATLGDFDVTGLELSDFLNIEVTAQLCAEGIGCEKCVSRLYKIANALCPFCLVTVTGDEGGEVVIIYEE